MGEPSLAMTSRRFGNYDVAGTIADARCSDGSTVFVAIARPPKAERDTSGKLALSFSPSKPNETTKTIQRPVVIKEIASSLTRDQAKLDAFLDAARVATTLRHGNVVEVESVGADLDHVYLVSDYVLGETAASLLRRLQAEGDRLKPPLAAFIAQQACWALDAGHSAGLIHGHLTPHDIFIGYDGSVQVIDLGIAEARAKLAGDRVSGVELEYASPEVCRHETLDPRTDVFSLGIILWELLSGLSPFERATDVEIARAICDDSVVPPKNIVPGLPRELSTITLQALLRDRGERFQTAKAMGTALDEIVTTKIIGKPADHLARLMKQVFAARENDKREMLKRVMAGTTLDGLDIRAIDRSSAPARKLPPPPPPPAQRAPPAPPPDEEAPTNVLSLQAAMAPPKSKAPPPGTDDQPSVVIRQPPPPPPPIGALLLAGEPTIENAMGDASMVERVGTLPSSELQLQLEPEPPPLPRPSSDAPDPTVPRVGGAWMFAVIGGLIAFVIILAVVLGRKGADPTPDPKLASLTHEPSATVARESPPPEPPAPAPAPAPTTAVAKVEEETTLHIETVPSQASIFIAGKKEGTSPMDLRVAKTAEPIILEIRRAGYATLKERVVPDVNQRLKLTLSASGGKPSPAPVATPYKKFE